MLHWKFRVTGLIDEEGFLLDAEELANLYGLPGEGWSEEPGSATVLFECDENTVEILAQNIRDALDPACEIEVSEAPFQEMAEGFRIATPD